MKHISKTNLKLLGKIALVVIAIFIAQKYLFIPLINSDTVIKFTEESGRWGYLIIISYTIFSHVLAPVAGSPGVIMGVSLYGMKIGLALLYIASLISCTINFHIARKYGRTLVLRLIGKKAMKEVDEFTTVEGVKFFTISRLFGFAFFDLISYAGGLTNITFRYFFAITAVCGLLVNSLSYIIFQDIDLRSEQGSTIWLSSIFVAAMLFGVILKRYLKKGRDLEKM